MDATAAQRLLVSVLSLGRPEHILNHWRDMPLWLSRFSHDSGLHVEIVIRNNDPSASFDDVRAMLDTARAEHPDIGISLLTGGANLGFGGGHNANFRAAPGDYVLILNDDIGFPHIEWLPEALSLLRRDERVAVVADSSTPRDLSPFFANGGFPGDHHLRTLKYAEASVMLLRGTAFAEVGMFSDKIDWAMCEDADLSLRLQQHGYRVAWMDMPHQHWRSTSFNGLPGSVRTSIQEHNRATLFATWRHSFASGRVGRHEIVDLWSDGMGDVFCALPHLMAELEAMTEARRQHVVINTPFADLIGLLGIPGLRVTSIADVGALDHAFGKDGISSRRSIRDLNFSLPVDIHALLCGALALRPAAAADRGRFADRLRARVRPDALPCDLTAGAYCVVHLESARAGHHGRGLSPARARDLLDACLETFESVVLVGKERRLVAGPGAGRAGAVVDLQGQLSLESLIGVLAHAGGFVGLDSFPAHVAQAVGVPAAVFFGSVHPLARIWDEHLVWPIIADLDCIGCYQTHLEPSVPFCMRHDQACTTALPADGFRQTLRALRDRVPFDWSALHWSFRGLSARLIRLMRHHPFPPERVFRRGAMSNEQVSNLIYQMTDRMAELLRGEYHTATLDELSAQVLELQGQVFTRDVEIEEFRRRERVAEAAARRAAVAEPATVAIQLADLAVVPVRCEVTMSDPWMEILSHEEDPQLMLPPIEGVGARFRLRLSCLGTTSNVLQLFWSRVPGSFTEDRMCSVATSPVSASLEKTFELAAGEMLWLRIDPLAGAGRLRLRGSLAGALRIGATAPTPSAAIGHGTTMVAGGTAHRPTTEADAEGAVWHDPAKDGIGAARRRPRGTPMEVNGRHPLVATPAR